ncbi:MAG: glycosyltransferase family 2 protein [Planctomycetes bacterium]|nr:glycosyltransferase family 2 protein [Planctomycetota bacterium]
MAPRVSVIVPVHNRPRFVREAVESALAQDCPGGHEIVVVDDGSTDDTPAVLASFGNRIRSIRQANAGPANARNRGFAEAHGDLFALLDSDDIWLPGKLAAQVAVLDATPDACLVHSDVAEFWEDGSKQRWDRRPAIEGGQVLRALLHRNFVHTMTVVLRRSAIEAVCAGGVSAAFDPAYPPCEDWDLWLRLAERFPFAADAEQRVRTRVHDGGISSDPIVVYTQGCRVLGAATRRLTVAKHPDAVFARREAARWHVKLGKRLVRAGRRADADAAFAEAVAFRGAARIDVTFARLFPKD